MSETKNFWYVVRQENGTCQVVSESELEKTPEESSSDKSQWGGFASEPEAIAKKIGLIRAGKCKPQ